MSTTQQKEFDAVKKLTEALQKIQSDPQDGAVKHAYDVALHNAIAAAKANHPDWFDGR